MLFYSAKVFETFVWAVRVHDFYGNGDDTFVSPNVNVSTRYAVGVSAIILVAIRVSEPFIWQELKRICTRSKPKMHMYQTKSLTSFLNSTINVEYVVMILKGISAVLEHREVIVNQAILNESTIETVNTDKFVQIVDANEQKTTYKVPEILLEGGFDME